MKTLVFSLLTFSFLLLGCVKIDSTQKKEAETTQSANKEFLISARQIGPIKKGMTIQEVLDLYPAESIKKVRGKGEFSEDNYDDYEVYDSDGKHMLTFTPERNNDLNARVETVLILDKRFTTDRGIGLSSTYEELTKLHKVTLYSPDTETIALFVAKLNSHFSIQKSELKEGWWNDSEKAIDKSKIPATSPFSAFLLKWR